MASVLGDANATLKDLTVVWENTVRETRPSLVPKICNTRESDGAYEKYPIPTNVAMPSKFEAERKALGIDVNATYQIDNQTYELTLDFNADLIDDAKAYSMADIVAEAAQSMALYPDYLLSSLVADGVNQNGYDGNPFYGDTHLFANAGANNIDNKLAGTGSSVAQISTDFAAALAALRGFLDNAGRLINPVTAEGASQLLVQCPLAVEQNFRTVMNASIISQTDNVLKGLADVFPDGYLTDANDWYLHVVGQPQRPYIFQERSKIETFVLGKGTEFYHNNNKYRIGGKHRFKLGYQRFERTIKTINS